MESSFIVNVYGQVRGSCDQHRTTSHSPGQFLTVKNEPLLSNKSHTNGFAQAALHPSGLKIAAVDYNGNIFILDLKRNRFWFVLHLDRCCSCVAFTSKNSLDLIVASADCSVSFVNSESSSVLKSTDTHTTCVNNIAVNEHSNKAVSSSLEKAVIWDLNTLEALNTLNLKQPIGILKVFFLPSKKYLISAFKDSSVFIWETKDLAFVKSFNCENDVPLWLKTIDASRDGSLIVCGGRTNLVSIWSGENFTLLRTLSLSKYMTSVKHITFLSEASSDANSTVAILSHTGNMHFFDMNANEHVHELYDATDTFSYMTECSGNILIKTSTSQLKMYNLKSFLTRNSDKPKPMSKRTQEMNVIKVQAKPKKEAINTVVVPLSNLRSVLTNFGEYPQQYRYLIWSQLLQLPRNAEYINYYSEKIDRDLNLIFQSYPIKDPVNQKSFIKVFSMLVKWCPILKEIDYLPFLVFPFIKVFRTNVHLSFELLVTFISNWCQNWFFYLPFPPFNVLCTIENLLLYHDRALLHHFLLHDISPTVYAFKLLRTSLSDVLDKDEWFRLWDHIFSNNPVFLLYVITAFNIVSRKTLLSCSTEQDFKMFFSMNSNLASSVIIQAYQLQKTTPACFDPSDVIGSFQPIPSGGYPVFNRFTAVDVNLQTLQRQSAVDSQIDYLQTRKAKLESMIMNEAMSSEDCRSRLAAADIHQKNLEELVDLQERRKNLVLSSISKTHVNSLTEVENKLNRVQNIIQQNLVDQVVLFNKELDKSRNQSTSPKRTKSYSQTVNNVLKLRENLLKNKKR